MRKTANFVPGFDTSSAMTIERLSVPHLLGIADLTREDLLAVFALTRAMQEETEETGHKGKCLAGRTIVNLFVEDSTRTRNSFQLAESRLGASVLTVTGGGSSLSKGETLLDTVRVIEAMGVDGVVVRHSAAGAPWFLAERCDATFINAGDGRHEHPTQALLDTYTLWERWRDDARAGESGFEGKRVTIVGDIKHGRVALSNILALKKLGADVAVCGPATLLPRGIEELGVTVLRDIRAALHESNAVNMLRMQLERQGQAFVPSLAEYGRLFGLDREKLSPELEARDLLILHPGPINRGVELDSESADCDRSLILRQVANGVAVRMAVLAMLLGPESGKGESDPARSKNGVNRKERTT